MNVIPVRSGGVGIGSAGTRRATLISFFTSLLLDWAVVQVRMRMVPWRVLTSPPLLHSLRSVP